VGRASRLSPSSLPGAFDLHLHSANDLFRDARQFMEGRTVDGEPCEQNLAKAEFLLHQLLNNNLGNYLILYTLGSLHLSKENYGLAIQLLSTVTQLKPDFGEAWNNLGLAFKGINNWDMGAECAMRATRYIDHPDVIHNVSGMYIGRNMPEKALSYSDRALEKDPTNARYRWNKALALLELRRWDEAWDFHEARLEKGGNEDIAHRNYHGPDGETPVWDGKSPGTIVIHGEQGMGDEIMFASCIPDALKTPGTKFICEPSPRTAKIFARAFPELKVYGTNETDGRDWIAEHGKPDFKIALGSLPKFYRRDEKSFPGTPYLKADPGKRAWWGDKINALGRRPNIGIAWQGGVHSTRVDARSFHPGFMAPIFAHDCNWISLQYDATAQHCVNEVRDNQGIKITHWPMAVEQFHPETGKQSDIDELVALISRLDMVITVCQTAVHVAGALGIPTLCLTPSQPSWRYGAGVTTNLPWYGSVQLIRQARGSDDWAPAIQKAADHLGMFIQQRKYG
jgi:tetratricopeptide (TPR) repeat protein